MTDEERKREERDTTLAVFKELCADRREGVKERLQFAAIFGAALAAFIGLYRPGQTSPALPPGGTTASQTLSTSAAVNKPASPNSGGIPK